MPFKKKAATATETNTAEAATLRNEPIKFAFDDFEAELSNAVQQDMDVTYDLLPEELQRCVDALLAKFNVESKGPGAVIFKYRAEKQQLLGAIALAHGDGMVVRMGDYAFHIDSATDITEKPYSFIFSSDHGGMLILDKGQVHLECRCFFDRSTDTKSTQFAARMTQATTAGDLSEFLARGEEMRKWSEEPENATYTVHDITPVPDRDDETKTAYAILLAEDADGNPIRLYAPGEYVDYAGIEFPVEATKDGYTFNIAGKELAISAGGSYCKLHELEVGVAYKVVAFDGGMNKFGNWQATFQLEDGRKVNGNKAMNAKMQGKPDDCISAENPGTLTVDSVETKVSKRDGKARNYVRARIELASDESNPLMAKLKARMAEQETKQLATVGNPL